MLCILSLISFPFFDVSGLKLLAGSVCPAPGNKFSFQILVDGYVYNVYTEFKVKSHVIYCGK